MSAFMTRLPARRAIQCDHGDQALNQDAQAALRSSGHSPLRNLACEMRHGVVSLIGSVPSFYLKQMAQVAILRLPGAKCIRNLITVTLQREDCPFNPRKTVAFVPARRKLTACEC